MFRSLERIGRGGRKKIALLRKIVLGYRVLDYSWTALCNIICMGDKFLCRGVCMLMTGHSVWHTVDVQQM